MDEAQQIAHKGAALQVLDVPAVVGIEDHAGVKDDQQQGREDAQGVDIIAAFGPGGLMIGGLGTLAGHDELLLYGGLRQMQERKLFHCLHHTSNRAPDRPA